MWKSVLGSQQSSKNTVIKVLHVINSSSSYAGSIWYLVLRPWSDVKPCLSHYWHVQMMHQSNFETLGSFVIVAVVKGLDIEEHGIPVVFAGFSTLKEKF